MPKKLDLDGVLKTALDGVAQTAPLLLQNWRPRQAMQFDTKQDATPVTEVDREVEQRIREIVHTCHPDHAVIGEEQGGTARGETPWLWVIDPIDGTKSYIRGLPYFGTQVAVLYEDEVVVGVSSAPALRETVVAHRGGGTFLNRQRLCVSRTPSLDRALIAHGELPLFERQKQVTRLRELCRAVWGIHGFQDFWSYHLVATGRLDAIVEAQPKLWDIAAVSLIVQEAGGRVTDLQGGPIGPTTTSCVATNGRVHNAVLDFFRPRESR